MKQKLIWFWFAFLLTIALAYYFLPKAKHSYTPVAVEPMAQSSSVKATQGASQPTQQSSVTAEQLRQKKIEHEKKIWDMGLATPIRFYGKVVDEKREPISGAKIQISMADSIWDHDTKFETVTDASGLFSASGHGLGIIVMVSKYGYYHLKESDGSFGYAEGIGTGAAHSDPANPAIFVLRKMGKAEPLIKKQGNFRISKIGTPIQVDLGTGRITGESNQAIKVECWTNDQKITNPNLNTPYDWHCQISVPGGGLVKRDGEFDFVAPEGGYQPTDGIDMPATLGANWRSQVTRNYYVQLASGNYARLSFMMTAGGDHFFSITSYLNPSGSRNLEYNPTQ
jgi:hypothetical protein